MCVHLVYNTVKLERIGIIADAVSYMHERSYATRVATGSRAFVFPLKISYLHQVASPVNLHTTACF